jgi:hypothetical protein
MVEQFCRSILQLEIGKSKSIVNLIMGLASQTNANSVVEVSLSPCYHFQYSSISKAIDSIYAKPAKELVEDNEEVLSWGEVEKKFVCT